MRNLQLREISLGPGPEFIEKDGGMEKTGRITPCTVLEKTIRHMALMGRASCIMARIHSVTGNLR